jgi:hypothetical protein
MWVFKMLAFLAGSTMNTGHQIAYLQIVLMLYLLQFLFQAAYPTDPMLRKFTHHAFVQGRPWQWPLQGRRAQTTPKHLHKRKKPSVSFPTQGTNIKSKLRTYLVPNVVSIFKVGCCVEGWIPDPPSLFY